MDSTENACASLKRLISDTEQQLQQLKQQLAELERDGKPVFQADASQEPTESNHRYANKNGDIHAPWHRDWPLLQDEYRRYGRQMIVDQIGLQGQLRLRNTSALIVGAGGLGCPAAMYLAGAGVGTIGIIDGDTVEASNLHRQVLHRTMNVGKFKVDSAIEYLQELNPHPKYVPHRTRLMPQQAANIFGKYDIILDCTDNPATRYLISDTAVLLGKIVVSASALRTEGQLMILNYPPKPPGDLSGGACYRCVFPRPPPADSVISCADGGIIGPVVGLMGVMQALETIRLITLPEGGQESITPSLHLFSAYSTPPFRHIRLRRRRTDCAVCSTTASVTLESLRSGSTDYIQFCGSTNPPSLLKTHERISATDYSNMYPSASIRNNTARKPVVIDVREKVQYEICAFPNSINIPVSEILSASKSASANGLGNQNTTQPDWLPKSISNSDDPIFVVCRQGNDSQIVVQRLNDLGLDQDGKRVIADIRGGLDAWRREVEPEFPNY